MTALPRYVCVCKPQLQRGQRSFTGAVGLAGTRRVLKRDALAARFLPSLRRFLLLLLQSLPLLRQPLVLGQQHVKQPASAGDRAALG